MGFIANIRVALHITDEGDSSADVVLLEDTFDGAMRAASEELNQTDAGAEMECESDKNKLHEPEPPTQRPFKAETLTETPPHPRVKVLMLPVESVRVYIDGRKMPEIVEFDMMWSEYTAVDPLQDFV